MYGKAQIFDTLKMIHKFCRSVTNKQKYNFKLDI